MQSKAGHGNRKRGILVRASLFRAINLFLSPIIGLFSAVDGPRKYNRMVRDIQCEMPWTITHLHPQIVLPEDRKLAMGRYATVTLKCPNYSIWITREFYGTGYDFWADVGSLSHPDLRVRMDTLAKQLLRSPKPPETASQTAIPTTLSDLDSLIRSLAPQLEAHFG